MAAPCTCKYPPLIFGPWIPSIHGRSLGRLWHIRFTYRRLLHVSAYPPTLAQIVIPSTHGNLVRYVHCITSPRNLLNANHQNRPLLWVSLGIRQTQRCYTIDLLTLITCGLYLLRQLPWFTAHHASYTMFWQNLKVQSLMRYRTSFKEFIWLENDFWYNKYMYLVVCFQCTRKSMHWL